MIPKPIGPKEHGALDYGFALMQALAPTLFDLKGNARTYCYASAAQTFLINALTNHPVGLKRVVPLRVHGQIEIPIVPSLLLIPWAIGAFRQKNARIYYPLFFLAAFANFLLTDYDACETNPEKCR